MTIFKDTEIKTNQRFDNQFLNRILGGDFKEAWHPVLLSFIEVGSSNLGALIARSSITLCHEVRPVGNQQGSGSRPQWSGGHSAGQ